MTEALGSHPHVGDVRREGLLCAVEFVEGKNTRTFYDSSKKIGVAVGAALLKRCVIEGRVPQGDILGFAPPLCLTRSEAHEIVGKMNHAVIDVLG
jgi:L-2,4-diaminobutyrate transaminase